LQASRITSSGAADQTGLALRINRMASTEELPEILSTIKDKLPEWRAQTLDLNKAMRDLDKISRQDKPK